MTLSPKTTRLYVGTYTRTTSRGVYCVSFDSTTGAVGQPEVAAALKHPTWLAWSPDHRFLYANDAATEGVQAFAVDAATGALTPLNHQPTGAGTATHLVVDATGRMLMSANYGSGTVSAWPIRSDGSLGGRSAFSQHTGQGPNPERQQGPHAHGVTLSRDNRFLFVPDLGIDRIMIYAIDPASGGFVPHAPAFAPVPPGSGPRHLAFSPDGHHAYVINEMGGTVTAFAYDQAAGRLDLIETVPTLPDGFTAPNKTAEIVVHPTGRFVYGSNRGHDSIAVYARDTASGRLTLVEFVPSGGKSPRHFNLSPDGAWLITVHEDSDDLYVFQVDPNTGRLTRTEHSLRVPQPVCVLFAS